MVEDEVKSSKAAIAEYTRRGSSFTPIRQLLLPGTENLRPGFDLLEMPVRTLRQMLVEDFVSVVSLIRKIYMPHWNKAEISLLESAYVWVMRNHDEFKAYTLASGEALPINVFLFYHSLRFLTDFEDGIGHKDRQEFTAPVAFMPGTETFQRDIRQLTFPVFEKLRYTYDEGKWLEKEGQSTTRSMWLISRLYWLADPSDDYFIEGADVLTRTLLSNYFISLKMRVNTMNFIQNQIAKQVVVGRR